MSSPIETQPSKVGMLRSGSAAPFQVSFPSWLVSLLLHGTMLMIFASTLKSCGGSGLPTDGVEGYQEVGIFLRQQNPVATEAVETEVSDTKTPAVERALEADSLDATLESLVDLPQAEATRPVIGPGPPSVGAPQGVSETVASSGAASAAPAAGAGRRAIPFFGTSDTGQSVVYVIDRSSSMHDSHALLAAKNEVIGSLESLEQTQTFQVIFYNKVPAFIPSAAREGPQMMRGTDLNRTVAGRFVAQVTADGGTEHVPALEMALKLQPDVIFFLTDADEPPLSRADFENIRRWNRKGTRIHTIEFGRGSLGTPNFLHRLAQENDGTYRFRDIREFDRQFGR